MAERFMKATNVPDPVPTEIPRVSLGASPTRDFSDMPINTAHPSFPWQVEALSIAVCKPKAYVDLFGWLPRYPHPDAFLTASASRALWAVASPLAKEPKTRVPPHRGSAFSDACPMASRLRCELRSRLLSWENRAPGAGLEPATS